MHLLGWFALIFLTLFGYSAGAVVGRRVRNAGEARGAHPTLVDTAMVIVLWCGALASRLVGQMPGWKAVAFWFAVASILAFALNCIQKSSNEGNTILQ